MDAHPEPTPPEEPVSVLARDGNRAVVHLPGRRFPALAVQGDTLSTLRDDAAEALELLASAEVEEATETLRLLVDDLGELLGFYEQVLGDLGMQLPYVRRA
ncbi:conserved hypothetical protein [Cellulomonas flavigena DSM 20109]|uniref:Uncharacterized protein n=1 Tax=Cellulomonas flavigena (strain ATCC 482 / DSM 20109 / BCRC 11376 / JCM 18109 / NBRC 3775 / NCIMB 8073 / NRS 134) TaxID=446466 RepID=D5ULQ9_CELFN|nr:hypothetical protein [Cellulomonas flavigena]ADG76015.1 conserved hypothetical protein [Cellulomonas flavigena DSM 20109]